MNSELLQQLLNKNIVVFAGAGISMGEPANMPNWYRLNDILLESLWNKVQKEYEVPRSIRGQFMEELRNARQQNLFPPDYQAQIMEDQVGMDYFNSLSSVDSAIYNPTHNFLAQLCVTGSVRAIITTNFDTMIEQALVANAVTYRAFYDEEGYNLLSPAIKDSSMDYLPIIKVHGTASVPSSMVDTLRQRLKGRSKSLTDLLAILLQKHYILYSGFSGADLEFDENYLGLKQAASTSPGFTYCYMPGSTIRTPIQKLIKLYGVKAQPCESTANDIYTSLLKVLDIEAKKFGLPDSTQSNHSVEEKMNQWANNLTSLKAVNMLFALAEAMDAEQAARYLADFVWRKRKEKDYEDQQTFGRFLNNMGRSFIFNFQTEQERREMADTMYLRDYTSKAEIRQYAYENLRALEISSAKEAVHHESNFTTPIGYALFGLLKGFAGYPSLMSSFPDGFINHPGNPSPKEKTDILYYYSFYADLMSEYGIQAELFKYAIQWTLDECDWRREAFIRARYALVLARYKMTLLARPVVERCLFLANKLNDTSMLGEALLVRGICECDEKDYNKAIETFKEARQIFKRKIRKPQWIQLNIEMLWCIWLMVDKVTENEVANLTALWDEISKESDSIVVESVMGFEPQYCLIEGLLWLNNAPNGKERALKYFTDAYNLALVCGQAKFAERCKKKYTELNVWDEVEKRVNSLRQKTNNPSSQES